MKERARSVELEIAAARALVCDWSQLQLLELLSVFMIVKSHDVACELVVHDVVVTVVGCALDGVHIGVRD